MAAYRRLPIRMTMTMTMTFRVWVRTTTPSGIKAALRCDLLYNLGHNHTGIPGCPDTEISEAAYPVPSHLRLRTAIKKYYSVVDERERKLGHQKLSQYTGERTILQSAARTFLLYIFLKFKKNINEISIPPSKITVTLTRTLY